MAVGEGDYTAWSRDRPYEENGRTGNKTKKGKPGMSSSSAMGGRGTDPRH